MPDRDTIQTALVKVQSGELSPTEAARWMLDQRSDPDPPLAVGESLASLINRLGPPPGEVVESWCHQLRTIACQVERQSGDALPAIDPRHWSLTTSGQLAWRGDVFTTHAERKKPRAESIAQIQAFRASLIPAATMPTQAAGERSPTAAAPSTDGEPLEDIAIQAQMSTPLLAQTSAGERRTKSATPRSRLRSAIIATATLLGIGTALAVLYQVSQPSPELVADQHIPTHNISINDSVTSTPQPQSSRIDPTIESATTPQPKTSLPLETLQTIGSIDVGSSELESEVSFSLDDLISPVADFADFADWSATSKMREVEVPEVDAVTEPPQAGTSGGGDAMDSGTINDTIEPDADVPDESPQQTRRRTVMSADLDSDAETLEPVILSETSLHVASLSFPTDVPLTLVEGAASSWQIHNNRSGVSVATITSDASGLSLQWTDEATKAANAASLAHGRITAANGSTIYLRPTIEADPWPIRVDLADVMPTWNLRSPIPPRVARISVELHVPEETEVGWIEPIAPDSLRHTRGLVVLTPKDGETVSLGLRLDIRCSRKLSCRVRFAGRLDPTMPWQGLSNSTLEQFANHLTQLATAVSNEATRLANVYEIAGPTGRKILNIKRDRNDALGETIRNAAKRVAELQTLIADVEAEATLSVRVWVQWPDTEQTLLLAEKGSGLFNE